MRVPSVLPADESAANARARSVLSILLPDLPPSPPDDAVAPDVPPVTDPLRIKTAAGTLTLTGDQLDVLAVFCDGREWSIDSLLTGPCRGFARRVLARVVSRLVARELVAGRQFREPTGGRSPATVFSITAAGIIVAMIAARQ